MTKSREEQLISPDVEKINYTIVTDAQTKLRPALQSVMGERIEATP